MEWRKRKLKAKMNRVIRRWITIACSIVLLTPTAVYAEERSAKDYMDEGIRSAYHNMNLLYEAYYDDEGNLEVQPAGHVAIEQEWDDEGRLISRTYLDANGQPMNRVDGYAKAIWEEGENGTGIFSFYDMNGASVPGVNILMVTDIKAGNNGWSEWMEPKKNVENYIITVGSANLGEKKAGDVYICRIEIEFRDVTASDPEHFRFWTLGSVDGSWGYNNVWNRSLFWTDKVPENGAKEYMTSSVLDEAMAARNVFNIGFRCDYWSSGSFRVRNISIQKVISPE